jgi:tetratricopeptide (TPR) repeat protein
MAYLAAELREGGLAVELLQLVESIPTEGVDEDTLDQVALTKGLLLYLAGQSPKSQALVKATIERLNSRGTANFVAAQLIGGLGTICAHEGKYHEAVNHFLQAFEMTSRLGIDTTIVGMAGNLSLSYGRLGMYDTQLYWLTRAPRPWGAEFGGFVEVQLAYSRGLAHGMRGRTGEISRAIEEVEGRMNCVLPDWLRQAWQLWKADLLLLAGRRNDARETARESLDRFGQAPLSMSFTGLCDRWMALVSEHGPELSQFQCLVEQHRSQLELFDALDQLEILCGASIVGMRTGGIDTALSGLIQERLSRLPPGVGALLRRLGFLPEGSVACRIG